MVLPVSASLRQSTPVLTACGSKGESQVRKENGLSFESLRIVTLIVRGFWADDSETATAWLDGMMKEVCEVLLLRW